MKIEKYVKNRAKQAKVGHLKIIHLALKPSNMAPISSKNPKIFQKNAYTQNLEFLLSMHVETNCTERELHLSLGIDCHKTNIR